MSVLIKGIELPTPPDELRLIIRPNGQVIICHWTEWDETEAVELPPHGRLIDGDAICAECRDWVEDNYKIYPDCSLCIAHGAPTIAEAEGEL